MSRISKVIIFFLRGFWAQAFIHSLWNQDVVSSVLVPGEAEDLYGLDSTQKL